MSLIMALDQPYDFTACLLSKFSASECASLLCAVEKEFKLGDEKRKEFLSLSRDINTDWALHHCGAIKRDYRAYLVGRGVLPFVQRIRDPKAFWKDSKQSKRMDICVVVWFNEENDGTGDRLTKDHIEAIQYHSDADLHRMVKLGNAEASK